MSFRGVVLYMKNNDEFRQDVYERFDEYKEKKAARRRKMIRIGASSVAMLAVAIAVAFPITGMVIGRANSSYIDNSNDGKSYGEKSAVTSFEEQTRSYDKDDVSENGVDVFEPSVDPGTTSYVQNDPSIPTIDDTVQASVMATEQATMPVEDASNTAGPSTKANEPDQTDFYSDFRFSDFSKFEIPALNSRIAINYGETKLTSQGVAIQWDKIVQTREELDDILKANGDNAVYYANDAASSGKCDCYFVLAVNGDSVSSAETEKDNMLVICVDKKDSTNTNICIFGIGGNCETDIIVLNTSEIY